MRRRLLACTCLVVSGSLPLVAQNAAGSTPRPPANPGSVECQGFVYPNRRLVLKLRPGERVIGILVAKGERVKAGQSLVRIEDPALFARYLDLTGRVSDYQALRDEIEVLRLDGTLHRAGSERLAARIEALRKLQETLPNYPIEKELEPLQDKQAEVEDQLRIITKRLDHSQARLRAYQASSEMVAQELDAVHARLEQDSVRAPFGGVVAQRALEPGRLAPDDVICELWDDGALLIEVEILQHQLGYLRVGQLATVFADSGRAEGVQGIVDSIEPGSLVPEVSGHPRFKAIVKLDNATPWLRPGMQVTVRLRSELSR